MKIAIDARFYGLENAGLGRYTINLISCLAKIDQENSYFILLRDKYFKHLSLPQNFTKVRAEFRHYSAAEQFRLPQLLNKIHPDLVHFLHFNAPLLYNKPFVVTIHDLLMHYQKGKSASTLPAPLYSVKKYGYKKVFEHAVKRSNKIIVPSNFVKHNVCEIYNSVKDKVEVVYEGVTPMRAPQKESGVLKKYGITPPYFVYAGNAYPHKNLERTITAINDINKHSLIQFAIVTSSKYFAERLGKYVHNMGVKHNIKIIGYLTDEELSVLYKNSVGFVYPSLMEGFGLPALEAISAGTLAFVSDIPVFREIYRDKVFYFDPYKTESISKTLLKGIALTEKKRKKALATARELLPLYSWEKMAQETLNVYKTAYES